MFSCRSRKILGVRRIFARISPNLPEKNLGYFLCEHFLSSRPYFGMISKKRSSCDSAKVGRHFFQIKPGLAPFLPRFSGILQTFVQISMDFARNLTNLTKSKLLGVRLNPRLL